MKEGADTGERLVDATDLVSAPGDQGFEYLPPRDVPALSSYTRRNRSAEPTTSSVTAERLDMEEKSLSAGSDRYRLDWLADFLSSLISLKVLAYLRVVLSLTPWKITFSIQVMR